MAAPVSWTGSSVVCGRGSILWNLYNFFNTTASALWTIIDQSDVSHFASETACKNQSKVNMAWFVVEQVAEFYSGKHQQILFGVGDKDAGTHTLAGYAPTLARGLRVVYAPDGGWDGSDTFGAELNTAVNGGVDQLSLGVGWLDYWETIEATDWWCFRDPDTWNYNRAARIHLYADEQGVCCRLVVAASPALGYDSAGFEIGAMTPTNPDNIRPAVFMAGVPRLITSTGNHYGWDDVGVGHCYCRAPNAGWTGWNLVAVESRTTINSYPLSEDGAYLNDNLYVLDLSSPCYRGVLRLTKQIGSGVPHNSISSPLGTRYAGNCISWPRVPPPA